MSAKPVRKKTTESGKRFTFSSFRDRVDSIKIEPIRSLTKRAYDYTDTSHFISTLEHWKEVNLSGNFVEFCDAVEIYSQSLPQIIHHQQLIFEALYEGVKKNDVYSIEPLLELLTQFIHDLGPDFLVYYDKTLTLLVELADEVNPNDFQNSRNSSNVLEWIFNSLTFIFKYLSRYLVEDLTPTVNKLLPILKMTKKLYISRFCCQALSFLVKKLNQESLSEIIQLTLSEELTESYCQSLTILYSEAIKNTQGTFHSKSSLILASLIKDQSDPQVIGLICDIILEILHHGTRESCEKFYSLVVNYLNESMEESSSSCCQILTTLAFAESGKKITNWNILLESVDKLITLAEPSEGMIYLLVIIFRNSEVDEIIKYHTKFFEFIFTSVYGLIFTQASLAIAPKVTNFGIFQYVQHWIDTTEFNDGLLKQLCLFLNSVDHKFKVPESVVDHIVNDIDDTYWKLSLLQYAQVGDRINEETLIELLESTNKESSAIALQLITQKDNTGKFYSQVVNIIETLDLDCANYIQALTQFIQSTGTKVDVTSSALTCLYLPDHQCRLQAINLLEVLTDCKYLTQISTIESTPLSIESSRDMVHNIRQLIIEYNKDISPSKLDKVIIVNYLFGLLTNKFQPCWQAVNEVVPLIVSSCRVEIWELAYKLLTATTSTTTSDVTTDTTVETDISLPRNSRLLSNFQNFDEQYLSTYRNIDNTLDSLTNTSYTSSSILRSNILQALMTVPNIVDTSKLIPILINKEVDEEDEDEVWSMKERNQLLTLFTKFKGLSKSPQAKEVYSYGLNLLSSKNLPIQTLALDLLLTWNQPGIVKYRDNLKNLLDETIFRDELTKLLGVDTLIEQQDVEELMPLIIRILFGRVQGSPKSNSKQGRKFAIINILPSLNERYIIEFIQLGVSRIQQTGELVVDKFRLNKINGFVNLLNQIYETLPKNYTSALETTIEPLVYSLICSQNRIELNDDVICDKIARNIRSNGMKCLNELFEIMGQEYEWSGYVDKMYSSIISPRLNNFAQENLQQPSSLLQLVTNWINHKNTLEFLKVDEYAITKAVLSLLEHQAKEPVISKVLDFTITALESVQEPYLLALVVDSLLGNLPGIIETITSKELGSKSIKCLLLLISGKYIDGDQETTQLLINSIVIGLNNRMIELNDKANMLISLASLINHYQCEYQDILGLYETCSKLFRLFNERNLRETLVGVFTAMGDKFTQLKQVSELLAGLNSYSTSRMVEYDFEKRLDSFRLITEEVYLQLDHVQWLPIVYCCLYFINDAGELSIRINASYTLRRFIDCYSKSTTPEFISIIKNIILPNLKVGIRKQNEDIQSEYVSVLEHLVQYYPELQDMKSLIGDEETNFFKNINHIQLHRRQRAIMRLSSCELSDNSIAHYILPIIERYAIMNDEKFVNVSLQAMESIKSLITLTNWNQYKAILTRYVSNLKQTDDTLKQRVNLIVSASTGIQPDTNLYKSLPGQADIDEFIINQISPKILKVLNIRDDETIIARAPLAECLINLTLSISPEKIDEQLPKILTNTCQVMRSRSQELRDAIRKTLAKIVNNLGCEYFPFIIKELKTALSRGSQIHVLSFTLHYLLQGMTVPHGGLDNGTSLIMDIVMEDIFGSAGQEKDAEGYTSKMKEVKFKKSFDTMELITGNITLGKFEDILNPIKLLLEQNVSYKTQLNLDELFRRIALGLNHNEQSGNIEMLHLCYEIFNQAEPREVKAKVKPTEQEQHFLTNLDRKSTKVHKDNSIYKFTLQRLSLDLLRTAISRHDALLTVSNLSGFIPLLQQAINSENEPIITSSLKILNSIARLPFDQDVFKSCSRKSLIIIKESPSTNSDICQAALKFLTTLIRHVPEITIKPSAISFVLTKIQPDLQEPNRQPVAFSFVKAIIAQHILIPEIYDVIESISQLMIVNHSPEIRTMSRNIYLQFLMEYDQGQSKLESQFKYLVNNLSYPTEEGRCSILELIHSIILKAGSDLLVKLSTSFFIGLANMIVVDTSAKCREMATSLISSMFKKLPETGVATIIKYVTAWLKQTNPLLKRCGFNIYKLIIVNFPFGKYASLDTIAIENILQVINSAKTNQDEELSWELLYSALSTFSALSSSLKSDVFKFKEIWQGIIDILLFPHSWIRLICSRLIGVLLGNEAGVKDDQLQLIVYKLIHQLRAPGITEDLALQASKNLIVVAMKWEGDSTVWQVEPEAEGEGETEREEREGKGKEQLANDYIISKISSIIKQETFTSIIAKKSCIQLLAMFIQFTTTERLPQVSSIIISSLYNFTDPIYSTNEELTNLSLESLEMIKEKLGIAEYTKIYTNLKLQINQRRRERKAVRSQLSVSNPEVSSKRKLMKHARSREKRKHEKDANGFYKSKKRATERS
ncbi:U3 small nucleolar RNA-associated protein 20 [Spathaspora sp. JA1]|nr:U3 small nucleolar RNA-associated protein 20 [Spathaspora sp. JA1]